MKTWNVLGGIGRGLMLGVENIRQWEQLELQKREMRLKEQRYEAEREALAKAGGAAGETLAPEAWAEGEPGSGEAAGSASAPALGSGLRLPQGGEGVYGGYGDYGGYGTYGIYGAYGAYDQKASAGGRTAERPALGSGVAGEPLRSHGRTMQQFLTAQGQGGGLAITGAEPARSGGAGAQSNSAQGNGIRLPWGQPAQPRRLGDPALQMPGRYELGWAQKRGG